MQLANDAGEEIEMGEGFIQGVDGDVLTDDPDRIEAYRAVGLADGFIGGTQAEQLRAWTYLVESGRAWKLKGWFTRRAIELLVTRMIKVSRKHLPKWVSDEVDRQQRLTSDSQNDSLKEKRDDSHN
jgi:hypothetical protein